MQNIPKIVRERLKATPVVTRSGAGSSAHPDADLLTAFTEQSLTEFERAGVLEHLSRCGDCREIVVLALPAAEEVSAAAERGVRTASRGWLSWPAWRWGFVAAGIVAISTVGVLRYQSRSATMALEKSTRVEVAANEPKKQDLDRFVATEARAKEKLQAPAAPAVADRLSASNSAAVGSMTVGSVSDAKKSSPQAESSADRTLTSQTKIAPNRIRGGAFAANALPHGPRVANQWQQNAVQNNAQNTAPVPPPPSAYPAQVAGQVAANTGAPTVAETSGVSSSTLATEAKNLDASRDDQVTVRAKEPVSSAAPAPAISAAPGAEGAMVNRPYPGDSAGGTLAKVSPGQMVGYVFDPSGAVVANARITVTPSDAKGAKTAVTDSQGVWLIAGLPTGSYKAQAEAPGFKTTVLALAYDADRPSPYRLTLDVGNVAETVEVTAGNAQVQTESARIASSVNGRDVADLITISPGATAMPRWTISATGGLLRSMDQGKTWQAVDVNAESASFFDAQSSATSQQIADKATVARAPKNKDSGKLRKQTSALTFRTVAATGSDVWVGGSGGALYHSQDSGNHWSRIVPASGGTSLTGDVIGLDFADAQHRKVSTSTSEVWVTGDGGLTWRKQ